MLSQGLVLVKYCLVRVWGKCVSNSEKEKMAYLVRRSPGPSQPKKGSFTEALAGAACDWESGTEKAQHSALCQHYL